MEREVDGILLAAHDLKAPLSTLRQLALSLEYAEGDEIFEIQREMVSVSERAMKQVNDLSKMARLDDGLFYLEPVSVRRVCDEATRNLSVLFSYNNRDLRKNYTNKSRLVTANSELLYSVIYNFCLNAMHYSEEETRSEVSIRDHLGKVRLSVRDYGPALPVDVYKEIKRGWLERPTSIAMRPGSSGLGLYISSKFSKYMNCQMGAIRHKDGTSFFIDLPVSRQARLV